MKQPATVAVTDLEYDKAGHIFSQSVDLHCVRVSSDETSLAQAIRDGGARHAVVGVNKYSGPLYDALPEGAVLARFGVGFDGIDTALAEQHGILCCNTPGVLDDSVAECAIGLMLTIARHIALCAADMTGKHWQNRVGRELAGKTLVIIGCGKIGTKVAKAAKHGFGMNVVGLDLHPPQDSSVFDRITTDYGDAVQNADFVSLHVPDIPATGNMINAETLAQLPAKAVLINTARGAIVDENALYDAVAGGGLAGAALDVFKSEPYKPADQNRDLRTLGRVLATPHVGSSTIEACERMARAALENIRCAENGRYGNMTRIP